MWRQFCNLGGVSSFSSIGYRPFGAVSLFLVTNKTNDNNINNNSSSHRASAIAEAELNLSAMNLESVLRPAGIAHL